MSRKPSTIEISDVIDQNGAARYGVEDVEAPTNDDATIAPWIDEPVRIGAYLVLLEVFFKKPWAFFSFSFSFHQISYSSSL